jgi:hypothetical protein
VSGVDLQEIEADPRLLLLAADQCTEARLASCVDGTSFRVNDTDLAGKRGDGLHDVAQARRQVFRWDAITELVKLNAEAVPFDLVTPASPMGGVSARTGLSAG